MDDEEHYLIKDINLPLLGNKLAKTNYLPEYKETVFWVWYRAGKPGAIRLHGLIEPTADGVLPSSKVLDQWIIYNFKPRGELIDEQVTKGMEERVVTEKVEMINRHTELGKEMQDISLEYLRSHKDELKPHTALRMLIEGVEIERKSRGLPSLIAKVVEADDETLIKQIDEILNAVDKDDLVVLDEDQENAIED